MLGVACACMQLLAHAHTRRSPEHPQHLDHTQSRQLRNHLRDQVRDRQHDDHKVCGRAHTRHALQACAARRMQACKHALKHRWATHACTHASERGQPACVRRCLGRMQAWKAHVHVRAHAQASHAGRKGQGRPPPARMCTRMCCAWHWHRRPTQLVPAVADVGPPAQGCNLHRAGELMDQVSQGRFEPWNHSTNPSPAHSNLQHKNFQIPQPHTLLSLHIQQAGARPATQAEDQRALDDRRRPAHPTHAHSP